METVDKSWQSLGGFESRTPCQFEPKLATKHAVMKTATSPICYDQGTIFFGRSFIFRIMIFCIKKQFFMQRIFTDKHWGNVFFGSFCSHSLVSVDSTDKFFPWEVLLLRMQAYFLEHCTSIQKILRMLVKRKCSDKNNKEELQS